MHLWVDVYKKSLYQKLPVEVNQWLPNKTFANCFCKRYYLLLVLSMRNKHTVNLSVLLIFWQRTARFADFESAIIYKSASLSLQHKVEKVVVNIRRDLFKKITHASRGRCDKIIEFCGKLHSTCHGDGIKVRLAHTIAQNLLKTE